MQQGNSGNGNNNNGMPMFGMPMGMPMFGMPMTGVPMMGFPMMGVPMMGMPGLPMMAMQNMAGNARAQGGQQQSQQAQQLQQSQQPQQQTQQLQQMQAAAVAAAAMSNPAPATSSRAAAPALSAVSASSCQTARSELPPGLVSSGRDRSGTSEGQMRKTPLMERSRSRDKPVPKVTRAAPEKEKSPVREKTPPPREKTPPRCHLHTTKKPNTKCKFCQKWIASQSQAVPDKASGATEDREKGNHEDEEAAEDYSRRTFKCSALLKDQIFGSSYFKSLLEISELEPLMEEISKYADTLDVYNSGNSVFPSCFICQVYRLFALPQSEDLDELLSILDKSSSAKVRCAGILYIRFVVPPAKLWDRLEENIFDDQELKYYEGDKLVTSTIRDFVESLLMKDKYYSTPLPRIPVKCRQMMEKELAPLTQYRKRMRAMQKELPKKVAGTPVDVFTGNSWQSGRIKGYVGTHKRKVSIQLEGGAEVIYSHLGKVVLRDEDAEKDSEDEKNKNKDEGKKKKKEKERDGSRSRSRSGARSRSRSRSKSRGRRGRGGSPDWARHKGSVDFSDLEKLRERLREEAVCGHGKSYAKRPTSVEGELWRGSGDHVRVSMLGAQEPYEGGSRSSKSGAPSTAEIKAKISREDEEEHKRRMREIYEKYGSASKSTAGASGGRKLEVDGPDVLRLG